MADYSKRDRSREELHRFIEAGIAPSKYPMPRCECGALATIGAYTKRGVFHFCAEHAANAEALL